MCKTREPSTAKQSTAAGHTGSKRSVNLPSMKPSHPRFIVLLRNARAALITIYTCKWEFGHCSCHDQSYHNVMNHGR